MNQDRIQFVQDLVLEAMKLNINGSIEIQFNNGLPVSGKIVSHRKPSIDRQEKSL